LEPTVSISAAVVAITGVYDKIKEHFMDFKPETRSMSINFSRKSSQMGFQITVPEGWRKSHKKIKIPAMAGYKVLRMTDEGFCEHRHLWKFDGENFVLNANELPASEKYLVEIDGTVDESILKDLVYIKPAANRDNDDENDKYWLDSSIKWPRALEKIYDDLEIDEVNFGVMIDIDKMFGLTIPPEVKNKASSIQRLLKVSSTNFDRNQLIHAALDYRKQEKIAPLFDPGNFFRIVQRLTAKDTIRQHISIDQPYDVGNINQPEKYVGIVPQNVEVQAITRLTLRTPTANGYLMFKREKYMDKLRSEFKKLPYLSSTRIRKNRFGKDSQSAGISANIRSD